MQNALIDLRGKRGLILGIANDRSIAYAPKADLQGRVVDCSADGFALAMDVSCHSFIRCARLAEPLMPHGGCLLTFTFHGGQKVVPHYDLMGPVKAALEASVRSMAAELGSDAARLVTGNVEFVDAGFHVMG